jgi:hypothetical protein
MMHVCVFHVYLCIHVYVCLYMCTPMCLPVFVYVYVRSMRSMRGGFIFRNRGPSLKVHPCQHLASAFCVCITTNLCLGTVLG